MYPYQQINIIGGFLRFTYIENEGIAFGIDTSQYHIYITILTFLAIFLIIYYYLNLEDSSSYEKTPILFIIGGAIGNAIDRFLVLIPSSNYKGVIDFIDMPNFLYYIGIMNNSRWFIFNIADCSITIGVILYFILQYKTAKNTNEHSRNI
tara:strand:+ start:239 stop:688 length:450 start_codon:yes stop_codon:yes gene_type:complete